jgi:hypothetical protein
MQPFPQIPALVANFFTLAKGMSHYPGAFLRQLENFVNTCLLYLIDTWHKETISSCVFVDWTYCDREKFRFFAFQIVLALRGLSLWRRTQY